MSILFVNKVNLQQVSIKNLQHLVVYTTHLFNFLINIYKNSNPLVNRSFWICSNPTANYMFKVNNRNIVRCEIFSKLTIRYQNDSNDVNFEHVNVGWELVEKIIQKNGYPENFIDDDFKLFLNRIHILKKRFLQLKRSLCYYSFRI